MVLLYKRYCCYDLLLQNDTRTKSVAAIVSEIQSLKISEFRSNHQNLLSYISLINPLRVEFLTTVDK